MYVDLESNISHFSLVLVIIISGVEDPCMKIHVTVDDLFFYFLFSIFSFNITFKKVTSIGSPDSKDLKLITALFYSNNKNKNRF